MVLVVGGAGYIGSHTCRMLRLRGIDHLVLDNFEEGFEAAIHGSPFVRADLRDRASLDAVFRQNPKIDAVIHFAAYISVGESVRLPEKYWSNNVAGTLNLVEAMRAADVEKLVFSSTAAVYGEPQYVPIDENHPKAPTSCYGLTKWTVEQLLNDLDVAHQFRSVRLRYFNASGADPSGEIGEAHRVEEHLIPLAIAAAQGKRPALKVFGTDWPTDDGTCIRDYIHVNDLAAAHVRALEHLRASGDSRAYNLGTGQGHSVRAVLDTVGAVVGKPVPFEDAPRRPGVPARLVATSAAIQEAWNWTPQVCDLSRIVEDAWRWHQNPKYPA